MASRRIEDLHPKLQGICKQFLLACESRGIDVILTCTYRSNEEQAYEYSRGRTISSCIDVSPLRPLGRTVTKAKPGESKHNHIEGGVPASLAFDFGVIVNGRYERTGEHPYWRLAGEIAENLGLLWYGRPGAPYKEMPHCELRGIV